LSEEFGSLQLNFFMKISIQFIFLVKLIFFSYHITNFHVKINMIDLVFLAYPLPTFKGKFNFNVEFQLQKLEFNFEKLNSKLKIFFP